MFTGLFFFVLLIWLLAGGDATEVAKFGCLWIVICLIGELMMLGLFFVFFGTLLSIFL